MSTTVKTSPGLDESRAKELRAFPTRRQNVLKWNGWGYKDTLFDVNDNGVAYLTGKRYKLSGQIFPNLIKWFTENAGFDVNDNTPSQAKMEVDPPVLNYDFINEIKGDYKFISFEDQDRVVHGHGATVFELQELRHGKLERVPDCVIWPDSTEHVECIVKAAHKHNVAIIPFGGGTNVTLSLTCSKKETRMIVSLDTTEMDRIISVNKDNMTARVQAGIIGQDLERKLGEQGLCTGHEPDSMEFSSLGGWIATRASGMKKNRYGNIEDIVVTCKIVTALGTMERTCAVPRLSSGPDLNHLVLGSEGAFGVVTEATLRVRNVPKIRRYGSIVFPNFESGVDCLHRAALEQCTPAALRLVDNDQFQLGRAMKTGDSVSFYNSIVEKIKQIYILNVKGFKATELVVATCLFEGDTELDVAAQEQKLYTVADEFNGMKAGEENGMRGYFLTFVIAYIRDIGMEYNVLAESFETSVPWAKTKSLTRNVKTAIRRACAEHGITNPMVTSRVSQAYDCGACVYFYFSFCARGITDPLHAYHVIEEIARDEILANGGSISHHHGVGKIRLKYLEETVTPTGMGILQAVKDKVDPKNIFATGTLASS